MVLRAILIFQLLFIGQTLGNGLQIPWVDASLKYIRIPVWEEGLYRIERNDINSFASLNGEIANSIPNSKFALFYRGEEIPLIEDGNDFLFYGRRNDGSLDSLLYLVGQQANPRVNLLSDTSYYFLTWYTDSRIGKRENQITGINPTGDASYFLEEKLVHYIGRYFYGQNYYTQGGGVRLRYASYQEGEGWTGWQYIGDRDYLITGIDQISFSSGVKPLLEIQYNGASPTTNEFSIDLGRANPREWIASVSKFGYGGGLVSGQIELSDFENDTLFISVKGKQGIKAINSARLVYPRNMDFGGSSSRGLILGPQGGAQYKFSPSNFPSGSDPNLVLGLEIQADLSINSFPVQWNSGNSKMEFRLNGLNSEKKFWFAQKDSLPTVSDFQWYGPRDLDALDPNYIILTHQSLMDACQPFKAYRESESGGGNDVLLIEFEEARNYFGYGDFSPLAIRNMLQHYFKDTTNPELSLFIVGKGLVPDLKVSGKLLRFNPGLATVKNLIPTLGVPGSDLPISTGFNLAYPTIPSVPMGRLAVSDSAEAIKYFNKVYEYEDPANKGLWNKKALHLSGGADEAEIGEFYGYVNQFKEVAESPYWGAEVKTFSKKVTGSTENIIIDSVVNEGLSLLTMYGHSSVNFSDIQIGEVDDPNLNYNNKDGKYPLFIINGCYSGRIFESFVTWAENWTLADQRGSIGVISQTDQGFNPILKHYTLEFYRQLFENEENYGLTIGEAQIKTMEVLTDRYGVGNIYIRAQNELMILHGDPNIRLSYTGGRTDYAIYDGIEARAFNTTEITSELDSFFLRIPVANLGITSDKQITVKVTRLEPVIQEIPARKFDAVNFLDTLEFSIPRPEVGLNQAGRNRFSIHIDPGNPKGELDTVNNISSFELTIPWKGVDIIYPREFSIWKDKKVTLQLASYVPEEDETYIVEIDTSYLFNGPGKITKTLVPNYGYSLKRQDLSSLINNSDSTVFYMRARRGVDTIWDEVSFSYFSGSEEGWSQTSFGQLVKNRPTQGLFADSANRQHIFKQFSSLIELSNPGGGIVDPEEELSLRIAGNWLVLFGALQEKNCKKDRLNFVRLNSFTGLPYRDLSFNDSRSCGISPLSVKSFRQSDLSDSLFYNYIGEVNEDDLILGFAMGELSPAGWSSRTFDSLAVFGLDSNFLKTFIPGQPFAFLSRRFSDPGEVLFLTSDSLSGAPLDSQIINFDHSLVLANDKGGMISTLIGPSIQWKMLRNSFGEVEASDMISSEVYGISSIGVSEFLFSVAQGETQLGSIVDAEKHPYIFIQSHFEDTLNQTAPIVDHWGVIFDSPPDGYLRLAHQGNTDIQEVFEGEVLSEGFWFINHSSIDFPDSIRVKVSRNGTDQIQSFWVTGPKSFDSVFFEVEINSTGFQGLNEINVFANPFVSIEETFQNNFVDFSFRSNQDLIPPVLTVYFDGHMIQDEDVVNNNPTIDLYLKDENQFLNISDPASIYFQLFRVVDFEEFEIIPQPGEIQNYFDEDRNELNLEYQPETLEPGEYLFIANGRDASGNRAGFLYYQVRFRVNGYQGITELEFFPNPFQTSLNVSFFVSGSEPPESLEMHFYNRHGKMVGMIDISNRIKLGSNRLYDIWDGNDKDGLPLQGGLYFIKFIAENKGNQLPISAKWGNTNLLKYGFGKVIYLPMGR